MMKRFTLCTVIALLGLHPSILHAQWIQVGYMITNGTDTAGIDHGFDAFGSNLYCSTIDGVFRSTDNGDQWENITVGKANVDGQEFYSTYESAAGALFAGSAKRLFKSTDSGSSWTWVSSLPDSATWFDQAEIGGNLLASYRKGANAGVYYSANGGNSWTMATGITSIPRLFLVDGSDVYLGGGANGVYKSSDNGQTWAIAGTGIPSSAEIWSVIKSGGAFFANSIFGKGLFVSRDNCATWANTDTTVFHDFCQVFSMTEAGGRIVASMDGACNVGAAIKSSTDIGLSWPVFMDSLPQAFYANLGRNAAGTAFFAKRGGSFGQKIYRYELATAVTDAATQQFQVFPNPATDRITIKLDAPQTTRTEIVIHDLLGKEIHRQVLQSSSQTIETSQWPRGIYTYKVLEMDHRAIQGKIILQ
jgi:hypothetical protein